MAFKGVQRFLDRIEVFVATASQVALLLKSTDDDQTLPVLSVEDSAGAETAHLRSDGRLRVGPGDVSLPSVAAIGEPATGVRVTSGLVILIIGAAKQLLATGSGVTIGAGATSPQASASLELQATDRALLLNRLTTTQRDALTPVDGMAVYNTTTSTFQGRASGAWVDLH